MIEINKETGETKITGKEPEVNPLTGEIIEQGESQEKTGDSTGNDAAGGTGGATDDGETNEVTFPDFVPEIKFEQIATDDDGEPIYGTQIAEAPGSWFEETILREKNLDELNVICQELREQNRELERLENELLAEKRRLKALIDSAQEGIKNEIAKTSERVSDTAAVYAYMRIFERIVPGTGLFSDTTMHEKTYVITLHDENGNEYIGKRKIYSGEQSIPEKYRIEDGRPFNVFKELPANDDSLSSHYFPCYLDGTLKIKIDSTLVENASETSDEKSDAGSDASETKIDAANETSETEAPGSDAASENDGKGGKKKKKAGKKEQAG